MRYAWLAGPALWLFVSSALVAQDTGQPVDDGLGPGSAAPAIVDHETVVVSGALPGPGLWKVRKDGHTLYVLATLSPLPRPEPGCMGVPPSCASTCAALRSQKCFTRCRERGMSPNALPLLPSSLSCRR